MRLTLVGGLVLAAAMARSAPGDLDASFGDHGRVRLEMPTDFRDVLAAQGPDGRLVLARTEPGRVRIRLVVMLPDGTIDTGFGTGGTASVDFGGATAEVGAIVVDGDGRILVGGAAAERPDSPDTFQPTDIAVLALRPDGTFDPAFGSNGRLVFEPGSASNDEVTGLALTAAGDLLLAVERRLDLAASIAVLRLTRDGRIDSGFGQRGWTSFDQDDLPGYDLNLKSVVVQTDGRIVACGTQWMVRDTGDLAGEWLVIRLLADGSLDPFLDGDGVALVGPGHATSCTPRPDGRLVIAGETSQYARVVRLLANGALDDSFGRDGVVDSTLGLDPDIDWSGWGSWPSVSDVAMLADERIVLGGRDYAGETSVLVLTPSGVPDWSFGPDGLRKIDTGDGDRGPGASTARFAVSAAGIVAATSLGDAVTVARLNVDERPGASTVGFRATYAAAFEKNERFVQQVHRSGSSEGSISVNYRTVDGTATAPADYTTRRGVIVWQDGDREPKEIEIPLVTGDLAEDAERFDLVLEAPMSAGLAASMAHIDLYDPTPPVAQSPARPDTSPPASASGGGGALDHFSLALLVLLWSASQRRRPRPSIIDKRILP